MAIVAPPARTPRLASCSTSHGARDNNEGSHRPHAPPTCSAKLATSRPTIPMLTTVGPDRGSHGRTRLSKIMDLKAEEAGRWTVFLFCSVFFSFWLVVVVFC